MNDRMIFSAIGIVAIFAALTPLLIQQFGIMIGVIPLLFVGVLFTIRGLVGGPRA